MPFCFCSCTIGSVEEIGEQGRGRRWLLKSKRTGRKEEEFPLRSPFGQNKEKEGREEKRQKFCSGAPSMGSFPAGVAYSHYRTCTLEQKSEMLALSKGSAPFSFPQHHCSLLFSLQAGGQEGETLCPAGCLGQGQHGPAPAFQSSFGLMLNVASSWQSQVCQDFAKHLFSSSALGADISFSHLSL